jgi:Flp pilus assembly protein TadG
VEFALLLPVLLLILVNVIEGGAYILARMEVGSAAQMGGQAARRVCDSSELPATVNCAALRSAVQGAVQATALGASISLQPSAPSEGYYCLSDAKTLVYAGAVTSPPPKCTTTGMPTQPGDYLLVTVQFDYSPKFPGLSIGSLLPTPIIGTARMRMDD